MGIVALCPVYQFTDLGLELWRDFLLVYLMDLRFIILARFPEGLAYELFVFRNCGGIFCDSCSDNKMKLPSSAKPLRYHIHRNCFCRN